MTPPTPHFFPKQTGGTSKTVVEGDGLYAHKGTVISCNVRRVYIWYHQSNIQKNSKCGWGRLYFL